MFKFYSATLSEAEYHDTHLYFWSYNTLTTNNRAGTESLAKRINELCQLGHTPNIAYLDMRVPSDFGPRDDDDYDSENEDVIACPYFADPEDYDDNDPDPRFPGLRGIRMLLPLAKVQLHVRQLNITFETWLAAPRNESIHNDCDGANPEFMFKTGIVLAKLREVLLANCPSAVLNAYTDVVCGIPQDGNYGGADGVCFTPGSWEPLSEEDLQIVEKEREMYRLKSELKGHPKKKKMSRAFREKQARVKSMKKELSDWDN